MQLQNNPNMLYNKRILIWVLLRCWTFTFDLMTSKSHTYLHVQPKYNLSTAFYSQAAWDRWGIGFQDFKWQIKTFLFVWGHGALWPFCSIRRAVSTLTYLLTCITQPLVSLHDLQHFLTTVNKQIDVNECERCTYLCTVFASAHTWANTGNWAYLSVEPALQRHRRVVVSLCYWSFAWWPAVSHNTQLDQLTESSI